MKSVAFAAALVGCATAAIDASHVKFVDYSPETGNFLFRTGAPANDTSGIAYEELTNIFRQVAANHSLRLPTKFAMVDFCLYTHETSLIEEEKKFFAQNPSLGRFFHYPQYGVNIALVEAGCLRYAEEPCLSVQPHDLSSHANHELGKHFESWGDLIDHSDKVINQMYSLLHTKSDTPLVIFGHCACGCDRTGQIFADYYMRFQNMSFTEAMTVDVHVPNRPIGYEHQVASQFYCLYLQNTRPAEFPKLTDCTNCKPFACKRLG
eukprot:TRINITY_DN50070_c0_g1_i1.p1 TRINITY_DN50070_c0_g1~~TRINITY_DN50070_c0_g1_i1.p1  ORF type:complete len:264 (-),score=40.33 TRINITY_DN50070_c0_g1_i1:363-1154(-)